MEIPFFQFKLYNPFLQAAGNKHTRGQQVHAPHYYAKSPLGKAWKHESRGLLLLVT